MENSQSWIQWVFSGIGTYFVQLLIGAVVSIFAAIFVRAKLAKRSQKNREGDVYKVQQSGFFNNLLIKINKK